MKLLTYLWWTFQNFNTSTLSYSKSYILNPIEHKFKKPTTNSPQAAKAG